MPSAQALSAWCDWLSLTTANLGSRDPAAQARHARFVPSPQTMGAGKCYALSRFAVQASHRGLGRQLHAAGSLSATSLHSRQGPGVSSSLAAAIPAEPVSVSPNFKLMVFGFSP